MLVGKDVEDEQGRLMVTIDGMREDGEVEAKVVPRGALVETADVL